MDGGRGPVALVGSGEFLPVMRAVDASLLEGRRPRAVVLPTAAAREGDERMAYWLELGRRHFEALGVEPVPLDVRTRAEADDPATAALVEGAGLVYLSGGDPHHLADTLRHSALWDAIRAAWLGGAALGGCSAGAMALTAGAPPGLVPGGAGPTFTHDGPRAPNGLGLFDGLAVIPHFDQMERWRPGAVGHFVAWQPPDTQLVGIDERTALVGGGGGWRVAGEGAAWIIGPDRPDRRRRYPTGDRVPLTAAGA